LNFFTNSFTITYMDISNHDKFLKMAFREALKAKNLTRTNPLVGALVVRNGKIISRGHHLFFGGPHAEEVALNKAGALARGADLYVTLEPCSTYGKRPPCTSLIKDSGIKNVYFGSSDINPVNAGKAVHILKKHGILAQKIPCGNLQDKINAPYIKYIKKGLPYVLLKAAVSLDGKMCDSTGRSRWITSPDSRKYGHILRSQVNAVLIGSNTFNMDDPRLTVRAAVKGRFSDPDKVILTSDGNIATDHSLFSRPQEGRVIIATTPKGKNRIQYKMKNIPSHVFLETFRGQKGSIPLKDILKRLASRYQIASVLVEGGANVLTQFLEKKLFDLIYLFIAPRFFGTKGHTCPLYAGRSPEIAKNLPSLRIAECRRTGPDVLLVLKKA
jgi:diaminohydroxyphosphoribosylaminopyrimidine deaminase / 5-amino-6-(5-phosphoribosylamino)uracil reductase